jgi:hypothetical protein
MRNDRRRSVYEDLCHYWREARRELEELRQLRVQEGVVDFAIRERVLMREIAELARVVWRREVDDCWPGQGVSDDRP